LTNNQCYNYVQLNETVAQLFYLLILFIFLRNNAYRYFWSFFISVKIA